MSWKNWPSWLRGGVILVIITFTLNILTTISCAIILINKLNLIKICTVPFIFLNFHSTYIFGLIDASPAVGGGEAFYAVLFIISSIFWFLIGSIIGFIIGKIKSSKNKKPARNKK